MKKTYLVNLVRILVSLILLLFIVGVTIFIINLKIMRDSASVASSLSATTGELAAIYLNSRTLEKVDDSSRLAIKDLVRKQSMLLVTFNLDVSEFDSKGFEGICRLVSKRKLLFSRTSDQSIEAVSNRFLNDQLSYLEKSISDESVARSKRIADQHICPGFR